MKYFALGLLSVFALIVLVGCAKKAKPYVPKNEAEKAVAVSYQAAHADRVITEITAHGQPINVDATEAEPATSIQPYTVSSVSPTDKKQAVQKSPVFYDTVKKTTGPPPRPAFLKNRPGPPGKK